MRNSAQLHRAAWLRRTRTLTVWAAIVATVATLLIAAVAGSANATRKAGVVAVSPAAADRRAIRAEERTLAVKRRRSWARQVRALERARYERARAERTARARAHTTRVSMPPVAPTPPPPPAPAPPPPAPAPVAVSGGS